MKLRQSGMVPLMIKPAVFFAGGRARMKLREAEKRTSENGARTSEPLNPGAQNL